MASTNGLARAFGSAGRVGPARALLATVLGALVGWAAAAALARGDTPVYWLTGFVVGATLAKVAAEWTRRLHDTGLSGTVGLLIAVLLLGVLAATGIATLDGPGDGPGWPMIAAMVAAGLVAAALLLRPGRRGTNAYGPPPSSPFDHAGGAGRSGWPLFWAAVSTLGCMAIAGALIAWSHAVRDVHARDQRFAIEHGAAR